MKNLQLRRQNNGSRMIGETIKKQRQKQKKDTLAECVGLVNKMSSANARIYRVAMRNYTLHRKGLQLGDRQCLRFEVRRQGSPDTVAQQVQAISCGEGTA